ncbi:hypothetical protein WBV_gp4 [White bream virus]|uniref:Membrane protein n=1 Tax=White bream virus (isolate Blicca bjoerkna L./Germany/DF24/00) TaxID=766180 RepID=VME1_WBV24|nr:hypothetical protein WBV_gp4 [White bream virus]Q008X3.1 RecName: Full=Membrane protein; Short=M protein; AltName: Full=E1 glycoprotein; AltName: Full=Matrix glycoprotein; AltName: Full=Membrane glycoprotein [White bream virus (strain DF24/00)]ABI97396.1 putative membrane protein [White bream virus]
MSANQSQSISGALSQLTSSNSFYGGNVDILSSLLQFNLMWASVFLLAIHLLVNTLVYYIPFVGRLPMVGTINNLIWFVATLLLIILVYVASDNIIVKAFGGILVLLLLLSVIILLYKSTMFFITLYYHQSFMVAARGPTVLSVNGSHYSLDFIPSAVIITTRQGKCFYNGHDLGSCSADSCSVILFSGRYRSEFEVHRNSPKKLTVDVCGYTTLLTVYTPKASKTDV